MYNLYLLHCQIIYNYRYAHKAEYRIQMIIYIYNRIHCQIFIIISICSLRSSKFQKVSITPSNGSTDVNNTPMTTKRLSESIVITDLNINIS